MRRYALHDLYHASAKIQCHLSLKNHIRRNDDHFLAPCIFCPDTLRDREKPGRPFGLDLILPLQKIFIRSFICQAQTMHRMHRKRVVPVPVCDHREIRKRESLFFQERVEFFYVQVRVARIDREAPVLALHIPEIRTVSFFFMRHVPYVFS